MEKDNKIINSVKCLQCGKVLISEYRHDFQMCDCENQTFCDGGQDYCRLGGANLNKIAKFDNIKRKYIPITCEENDDGK